MKTSFFFVFKKKKSGIELLFENLIPCNCLADIAGNCCFCKRLIFR